LRWTRVDPSSKPAAQQAPAKQDAFTAWGKELSGLQAGLGYRAGQRRTYNPGTTVTLVVRVRNVGKEPVTIQYHPRFFIDYPPTVTDAKGKPAALDRRKPASAEGPLTVTVSPGKEAELYELKLDARTGAQSVDDRKWTLFGTGKFQVQYVRVMYSSGKLDIDPILGRLGTGTLDLDIQFPPPEDQRRIEGGDAQRNPARGDEDPPGNELGRSDRAPAAGMDTPQKKAIMRAGSSRRSGCTSNT
jgi:hypothetical protein